MRSLDREVLAGFASEEYLKQKLVATEDRLVATEGLAWYNGRKVDLIKGDLEMLKYTL